VWIGAAPGVRSSGDTIKYNNVQFWGWWMVVDGGSVTLDRVLAKVPTLIDDTLVSMKDAIDEFVGTARQ
jgi:hypothetical protein